MRHLLPVLAALALAVPTLAQPPGRDRGRDPAPATGPSDESLEIAKLKAHLKELEAKLDAVMKEHKKAETKKDEPKPEAKRDEPQGPRGGLFGPRGEFGSGGGGFGGPGGSGGGFGGRGGNPFNPGSREAEAKKDEPRKDEPRGGDTTRGGRRPADGTLGGGGRVERPGTATSATTAAQAGVEQRLAHIEQLLEELIRVEKRGGR